MKKIKFFLLAAVMCLTFAASITAVKAHENLNLSPDFWSGQEAENDGYLKLTTNGNECFFGVSHTVSGNYTLEYEFMDLSPWQRAGGEWQNSKGGGEAWVVLGSKKVNGQWQGDVRGNGSDGVCLRVTDGSMESYDFVGGPYPFFDAQNKPITPNTAWKPAGAFARLIDARIIYRYVVKADERKVEIWSGFKGATEPDLKVQYRGYLTYGDSSRTDGDFMIMLYNDTLIDNFKIEQNGEKVFSLDFNGAVVPSEIVSSLPKDSVNIVNYSKTIKTDNPLTSQFYIKWDFYKQSDYLLDAMFYAKSASDSDSLDFIFGKKGDIQKNLTFSQKSEALSISDEKISPTIAGTAKYDLSQGTFFRILINNNGLVEVYVIEKDLRCPADHCAKTLLNAYQLALSEVEGYIALSASGIIRLEGFTVGERSIGVNSIIKGLIIDKESFSGAKVNGVISLSATFDITSPFEENMGIHWSVESGKGQIVDGNKLKINGTGAIKVRAVSLYDESIYDTATVFIPEVYKIVIENQFDKKVGSIVSLNALVLCKPNLEDFTAVKWQVIEGDADIVEDNKLKINAAGRVTIKAISLTDRTINAEYSFIAGQNAAVVQGNTVKTNYNGLGFFITLSVIAVALSAAAAVVVVKNKKM